MESNKTDDDLELCASASNFPSDHRGSFHQRSTAEFVDHVQSHVRSIMERIRVIKETVYGIDEDKNSVSSSEVDTSLESENNSQGQTPLRMNPQEQSQKIKERVEKIVELVRTAAQQAATQQLVCQKTPPAVEERTSESKCHRDISRENENLGDGEEGVGATSSERAALVVEQVSDCCALITRSSEEKKLDLEEPIAGKIIDKQIANEMIDRRGDSIAETAAFALSQTKQKDLKKPSNGRAVCGYVKAQPCSTQNEDLIRKVAKILVQEVFARIGCHESFVRRTSWADEPSGDSRGLDSILMAYSFSDPYKKIPVLNQERSELLASEQTETDGVASTARPPKMAETETEEAGAESSASSTDQSSKSESLVTSRDGPSRKRISFKRGQQKWAGLKKRRKSFVVKRKGDKNRTRKMLPWQKSTDEIADYSKVESEFVNDTFQPADEPWPETAVDQDRLATLKEFIVLGGAKTKDGEDVVVLNPSKIPSKREFTGRNEYDDIMEFLLLYVQKFTEEKVKTDKFVVTVHAATQRRSRLRSRKWATELYKLLKDRYETRLTRCVLFKPSFKLKALVLFSWPFFSNCMKEKIFIVKSRRDFAKAQGLPESDPVNQ